MQKVLVTGANGLLGANLVRKLDDKGFRVRAMHRRNSNTIALNNVDCEFFKGDIAKREEVFKAVSGCEYVIHVAARTTQFPSGLEYYQKDNIDATRILVEACKHNNIKRFIFVSTANCFGNGTIEEPGDENSEPLPWVKKSGYVCSKLLMQKELILEAREKGFPAIIVNPTFIIGQHDSGPSSGKLVLHALNKKFILFPPGGKSFVDAEDAANAICNALEYGRPGEAYLLAGTNLTYKELFKRFRKHNKRRTFLIRVPGNVLYVAGYLSEIIGMILPVKITLNRVNARLLCLGSFYSNKKAAGELGMETTDIDKTLDKAVEWFRKNGYI